MERLSNDAPMETQYLEDVARTADVVALPELLVRFRMLLGQVAHATGETPRTILEEEFKKAPSDEFWRATIGVAR
jgi:hypothetical protein